MNYLKSVLQRVYEILKTYIRLFDVEKLLERCKVEQSNKNVVTELSFLVEELKAQVSM
jgi:hypothetical protein